MRYPVRTTVVSFSIIAAVLALPVIGSAQDASGDSGKAASSGNGQHVFMQARCYACHGEYGFGGVGPRFRENRFLGMADYVVGQILIGRGVMPSFSDALSNQQIAAVATYIRNSWGNQFGPVSANEVAKVRQQVKLQPPPNRPHLPPESQQPSSKAVPPNPPPVPPYSSMPPGQAIPPDQSQK